MNFDTKHLVRWGIPGWILIMILGPFIYIQFQTSIEKFIEDSNTLALGAFLTVIGVPLGYLLNQIHHSLFWVIKKIKISRKIKKQDEWYKYFRQEIQVDKMFFKDELGQRKKERYQYLLNRKHELGGVTVSLGIVCLVQIIVNCIKGTILGWPMIYFVLSLLLLGIISISRWYSSKNIDKYFEQYVKESKYL
ncbi:hypothetical protein GI482_09045 [Bacillus sp. N3536]|nr:hypothetical protein GI482_09045 [Bacillus sp. N3536]